jgi:flagellar biosynthesis/type III secretory pathway M-ring protein FliF/YscJ
VLVINTPPARVWEDEALARQVHPAEQNEDEEEVAGQRQAASDELLHGIYALACGLFITSTRTNIESRIRLMEEEDEEEEEEAKKDEKEEEEEEDIQRRSSACSQQPQVEEEEDEEQVNEKEKERGEIQRRSSAYSE